MTAECALALPQATAVVGFNSRRQFIVWPLLVGAFSLQLISPLLLRDYFYIQLLCDDLADLLSAFAIFYSLPYSSIKLKLFALSYAMWSNFVFLNNIAVEVAVESIRQWQFMWAAICLCFYGFVAGWTVEIHQREKDY